jgi:transglutaminase-like putative cysteine protease
MIALLREVRIPARYVSGYLFHRTDSNDRSAVDATHAWIEAWLPKLGWVGFDPTNNLVAAERHIRVGVGRDYADVPPTRGVYKGGATSELSVAVQVSQAESPANGIKPIAVSHFAGESSVMSPLSLLEAHRRQQQQQQQQ